MKQFYILSLLSSIILSSCNLQKEVEIDLPDPVLQTVVECYLEPGKPYRLLLTKNQSYFADFPTDAVAFFDSILVNEAEVSIFRGNEEIPLSNQLNIDFDFSKVYNYYSPTIVPYDTVSDFELRIQLKDGGVIRSQAHILPIVPIDSVIVQHRDNLDTDSIAKARILIFFTDDPDQDNYYRRMFHWNSLDSVPEQDFVLTDDLFDTPVVALGSGFFYNNGDTIYNSLFHMTKDYYDYQNSIFQSVDAALNPFGTPGLIESNVVGENTEAIGVFAGLSIYRDTTILEF